MKNCTAEGALRAGPKHAAAFAALAHATRLRVFFHLVRAGGEVAAGELARALRVPAPTLTHHLALLRRAGLVRSRRENRFVYSVVDTAAVTELVRILTACC